MKVDRVPGVYLILNTANGNFYIGSAVNIENRFSVHKTNLRKNNHHCRYLQNAWNKYGEQAFEFHILELCERVILAQREQFWFDNAKPRYNIAQFAHSNQGLVFSEEARRAISEAQRRLCEDPAERIFRSNKAKAQWATPGIMDGVMDKLHAGVAAAREERIAAGLPGSFLTPEHYRLIGEKNTGRKNTPEACKNISEGHKNVPWSDKQREAMAKSWTEERRRKASERAKAHGLGRRIKAGGKSKEKYAGMPTLS